MCIGQEKLKNRCIQLAKKDIKKAFPNILTFTTHFTIKTSNILSFHYYAPPVFSHYYYSTFPFLLLPHPFYLYLTPFYHLPHSCPHPNYSISSLHKEQAVTFTTATIGSFGHFEKLELPPSTYFEVALTRGE